MPFASLPIGAALQSARRPQRALATLTLYTGITSGLAKATFCASLDQPRASLAGIIMRDLSNFGIFQFYVQLESLICKATIQQSTEKKRIRNPNTSANISRYPLCD